LAFSALHTWKLGLKFGQAGMASFNTPPEDLKVKLQEFIIFGLRVSRVPQISADFWF
jgi:hypothetical protein